VIEQSKDSYYLALRQTQNTIGDDTPDWQPWVVFFLKALQKQKERLAKKIEREKILLDTLPELSLEIIDFVKAHGRLSNSQIVELTGANRNTVKKQLQSLTNANHLVKHGTGKGTWYSVL